MALLQGFEGSVTITIGMDDTVVGKVRKWSAEVTFKEQEEGPFIGSDGTTEVVSVSKMLKGKLECAIPSGGDAGQTALLTQALALGSFQLDLVEDDGYTINVPTAKVSGLAFDNDGGGTPKLSFDFRNSGSFTIAETA